MKKLIAKVLTCTMLGISVVAANPVSYLQPVTVEAASSGYLTTYCSKVGVTATWNNTKKTVTFEGSKGTLSGVKYSYLHSEYGVYISNSRLMISKSNFNDLYTNYLQIWVC